MPSQLKKPPVSKDEEDRLAMILWEYLKFDDEPKKSDIILVLGSNDLRMAEYAAQLFLDGHANKIMFSGKRGRLTEKLFREGQWKQSEAEMFADVAVEKGVPKTAIIIEPSSTNTGENIAFSRKIIKERGIPCRSIILVQKPYMGRRSYATFKKLWPEPRLAVTAPPIGFKEYPTSTLPRDYLINLMVGDLQRIRVYPSLGFQVPQRIPNTVWDAYKKLVALGFTNHLVKTD